MEAGCRKLRLSLQAILWSSLWAACTEGRNLSSDHPLRFWIDEYAFSEGETTILREEIEDAGKSVAVVAGETRSTFLSVKGYYAPDQWDIYWTGRQGCVQALPHALPGHKISCVPGLHELTMKDRLVARLTQFYGEGAFEIIPRSYLLPTQYWQWRLWLAAQEPQDLGEMWVLKEERHRGKGVHVMPLREAKQKAKTRRLDTNYDVAQAYIGNQMTVAGRRFYVRLWAVVTSSFPLRAYLFDGGVVVFGNAVPEDQTRMTSDDFIVNLWHLGRTTEAAPWSVADFRTYVDNLTGSKTAFDALWRGMQRSLGLTFAAGVQAMRFSAASFPVAAASATFELVGIDFLVDDAMRPWLLEVNAVPSLARKVINCEEQAGGCRADGEAESVFDVEKEKLVHSLFRVLQATAGTRVGLNGTAAPGGGQRLTLAELMQRWRSNATDLAALNRTNSSTRASTFTDLGWHSTNQAAADGTETKPSDDASARSLQNSGRELKGVDNVPGPDASDTDDDQPSPSSTAATAPHAVHHIARAKSVAEASNLNKYVPEAERTIPASKLVRRDGSESHEMILEQHLMTTSIQEIQVAIENRFLPLMMIPEAASYSAEHQTRGSIFPLPKHKHEASQMTGQGWASLVLLPFRPVALAYGGLGHMLERLRVGLVGILPDVNYEVTMGIASTIPGADWLLMRGYRTFSWGDRQGTVEALGALPQHRLDQRLAEHVRNLTQS